MSQQAHRSHQPRRLQGVGMFDTLHSRVGEGRQSLSGYGSPGRAKKCLAGSKCSKSAFLVASFECSTPRDVGQRDAEDGGWYDFWWCSS